MIKKLLTCGLLTLACAVHSQSFNLVYEFGSVTGTSGTVDPSPAPTATGVTSGSWTANNLSANPTTTNVFAFTNWTSSPTPNLTKYFELTLTPQPNYMIDLSYMTFYMGRSNTGPQQWCVRTSADNFAANAVPTTSLINPATSGSIIGVTGANDFIWGAPPTNSATASTVIKYNNCQVNFTGITNVPTPVSIRIYAYNTTNTATTGSWRIDSAVVYGKATFSLGVGLPKLSFDLNSGFNVYPNPNTTGAVTIEAKNNFTKVEVVNIVGAVVASQNGILADKVKLDLSTLPQGTYFVRITNGDKVSTEKLIISQ